MIAQISNVFALHDDPAGRGNDGPAMMTMVDDQEEEALTKPASTDDAHTRHFHVCLARPHLFLPRLHISAPALNLSESPFQKFNSFCGNWTVTTEHA